jgi:hypothetical protein
MLRELGSAFIKYHRGLGKMPLHWKPWLAALFVANMIVPLFCMHKFEARVVFGVALLNGATFVVLTAISGFSRLLGLGHIWWFPLIYFLWLRLDTFPAASLYGFWIRAVIVLNAGSLVLDIANVIRYARGDRAEMVEGLS